MSHQKGRGKDIDLHVPSVSQLVSRGRYRLASVDTDKLQLTLTDVGTNLASGFRNVHFTNLIENDAVESRIRTFTLNHNSNYVF